MLMLVAACDSFPGSFDVPPEGPAKLQVHNSGSRIITSVELKACSSNPSGDNKWVMTNIAPGQNWTRGYNQPGCYNAFVAFNSGGDWNSPVTLSLTTTATINPF